MALGADPLDVEERWSAEESGEEGAAMHDGHYTAWVAVGSSERPCRGEPESLNLSPSNKSTSAAFSSGLPAQCEGLPATRSVGIYDDSVTPMPFPFVISAALVVCERVLVEKDDVLSAIRMVDIFILPFAPPTSPVEMKPGDPIPSTLPQVNASVIATIKATLGHNAAHIVEFKILDTGGELANLGEPQTALFTSKNSQAPSAVGFVAQLNLAVRRLRTTYAYIWTGRKSRELQLHPHWQPLNERSI